MEIELSNSDSTRENADRESGNAEGRVRENSRRGGREPNDSPAHRELTVMIFFAGDSTVSPSMVSQLKSIKDAGYQKNTTVLVRYDPNAVGACTKIFAVNEDCKKTFGTKIGDGADPYVRNLTADSIEVDLERALPATWKGNRRLDRMSSEEGLHTFLEFGRHYFKARHYILFLVGHGMIVANDAFLPDVYPETAISLVKLGAILNDFGTNVRKEEGTFDLVSMHSCSMSSIEVAYQLQGSANYLMSTQGYAYVGSWPYRQLLKKIFSFVSRIPERKMQEPAIRKLLRKLHFLSMYNGTDFMFAGLSADLCLTNLNTTKAVLDEPVQLLTWALRAGLKDYEEMERVKELILLAHLQSQSFYDENYTDLYDFCLRLRNRCQGDLEAAERPSAIVKNIHDACEKVMKALEPYTEPEEPKSEEGTKATSETVESVEAKKARVAAKEAEVLAKQFERPIVYATHFGPMYQYARGLSIYFPWAEPKEMAPRSILRRYSNYDFTTNLRGDSWLSFLELYFKETKRKAREVEDGEIDEETLEKYRKAAGGWDAGELDDRKPGSALDDRKSGPPLGDEVGADDRKAGSSLDDRKSGPPLGPIAWERTLDELRKPGGSLDDKKPGPPLSFDSSVSSGDALRKGGPPLGGGGVGTIKNFPREFVVVNPEMRRVFQPSHIPENLEKSQGPEED